MPGITRKGKDRTGGMNIQGSSNVFVNGSPAVRVGDRVLPHGVGTHNSPVMIRGSRTVFVNGKKVCRKGDVATCYDRATGSSNVFAG